MTSHVSLNLPLDEMVNGRLYNHAKPEDQPLTEGNPKIIPDDQFGSCLSLDGSSDGLTLVNPLTSGHQEFTFTCWIQPHGNVVNYDLIGQQGSVDKGPAIWVDNGTLHVELTDPEDKAYEGRVENVIKPGKWQHLALVKQGTQMTFFMDQTLIGTNPAPENFQSGGTQLSVSNTSRRFRGKLAHLCCFDGALTSAEILKHIAKTQNATSTFKLEYPVAFNFSDDGVRNSFFISESAESNRCQLTLENIAGQRLSITSPVSSSEENEAQFQLKFKPQTFQRALDKDHDFIKFVNLPEGWTSSPATTDHHSGQVSLHLSYAGTQDQAWEAGEELVFDLEYASADGTAGTRGSNVELIYQGLVFPDTTALANSRIISAEIINQRGKQQIPLHAGIVGPNKILNHVHLEDQTPDTYSNLTIRIVNGLDATDPGKNRISFNHDPIDPTKKTRFTLLFDDPVGRIWDLANIDELKAIKAQFRYQTYDQKTEGDWIDLTSEAGGQGVSPVFTFIPPIASMAPGDYFEIRLSDIRTSAPSGLANIYLKYEDISGYWDGQFVLPVEKTPMIFNGGKVGMGTTDPQSDLTLFNKDLLVEGGEVRIKESNVTFDSGKVRINEGDITLDSGKVILQADHNRDKLRLSDDPGTKAGEASYTLGTEPLHNTYGPDKDSPDVIGHKFYVSSDESGNNLAARIGKGGESSEIKRTESYFHGAIGIGIPDPTAKIDVGGDVRIRGGHILDNDNIIRIEMKPNHLHLRDSKGETKLSIDEHGQIGVGTEAPQGLAHFRGSGNTDDGVVVVETTEGGWGPQLKLKQGGEDGHEWQLIANGDKNDAIGPPGSFGIFNAGSVNSRGRLIISKEGYVGIGTTEPKAPLHIGWGKKLGYRDYYFLNLGGTGHNGGYHSTHVSIHANGIIKAGEFRANAQSISSDTRIKSIDGKSNGEKDLGLLSKIEVTDYHFKDQAQFGDKPQKKVIGQQIAEVYPQAVSTNHEVIPDIMKHGEILNGWVTCSHELKVGEVVKILFETDEEDIFEVLEISGTKFKIASDQQGKVLVYGREVDDFLVVDYDAISMLNVSATQQLHKLLEQQQNVIEGLTQQLQSLEQQLEAVKKEI